MYNFKDRAFLLKNHLKSVLGSTQMHSLEIRGKEWKWLEAGSPQATETVVLLHGLSMSKNHWRSTLPLLAKNYRVIVPDVPGFKSGLAANRPELGFEGIAQELSDFLGVVVGHPVHLVGHSMAATLSLGLALRMPVPVRSITLVSLADVNVSNKLSIEMQFRRLSEFFMNMDEEQHLNYIKAMFYFPPPAINMIAKSSWESVSAHKQHIGELFQAMEKEISFVQSYGMSLDVPLLVINGKQDLWLDLTTHSSFFEQQRMTRVELDYCRHLPFLERPIEFSAALTQFLSTISSRHNRKAS